jgi:hypothetical protein
MSNSYVRKTDNPNMGWSDERRAKYSAQCKEAHANGTRYKKSKKAVGLAISNGRKEATKRKNRSEGQKRRHRASSVKIGRSVEVIKEILAPTSPNVDDQVNIKELHREVVLVKEPHKEEALDPLDTAVANAIIDLFDLIEDHLGVRPKYDDFLNNAVEDKLAKFKEGLCR